MRKLASIQRIEEVKPIEGADFIVAYRVGGWWIVDRKDSYQVGDLACYLEIDSFAPTSLAPFLSKGKEPREYEGVRGERVRTIRLKGQISQGLLLSIEHCFPDQDLSQFTEELDVTEQLGIIKWERPIPLQLRGQVKGNWPAGIPKTDEERIQSLTKYWDQNRLLTYEVSEKVDGSSMTAGFFDNEFIVCSRNINLKETDSNRFWLTARKFMLEEKLLGLHMTNLVLQGELLGPGIQGNPYQLEDYEIYVFSVFDQNTHQYLDPATRRQVVADLGLNHVPIIHEEFPPSEMSVSDILLMADGRSQITPSTIREGLVFKQVDGPVHWKAISNDFLLKNKD